MQKNFKFTTFVTVDFNALLDTVEETVAAALDVKLGVDYTDQEQIFSDVMRNLAVAIVDRYAAD